MPKVFSINELVTFAIEIENEGIQFYKALSEKATDTVLKETYDFLVKEEVKHKAIFEALVESIDVSGDSLDSSGEYHQYLRALVEEVVFEKDDKEISRLIDDAEVLQYAISQEQKSILFYLEMKQYVPERDRHTLDKIIEEERWHVVKLVDLKEKFG